MNLNIEKITNGYLVTIDGKKTFYDVPEAICGATAEWVLAECKRLDSPPDLAALSKAQHALAQAQFNQAVAQQYGASPAPPRSALGQLLSDWGSK
jgi:hypothetical protein